ncbi:MAG: LptA/OstA family protein [Pseudomonadales bacterium]|nr:LptA/OstA family protein [Pseudomonadales bacterium]
MTRPDKTRLKLNFLCVCCALGLAMPFSYGWGLSSDQEQELVYTADGNSTIANSNGQRIVTVRDNVFVKQGSMELRGSQAVFEYDIDSNELQRITVTGAPARFQQEPDSGEGLIQGSSDTIIYLIGAQAVIDMTGNASFNQNGSQMQCVRIQHNIDDGSTEMTGPCSGTLPPQSN